MPVILDEPFKIINRLMGPPIGKNYRWNFVQGDHSLTERGMQFRIVFRIYEFMVNWQDEINAKNFNVGWRRRHRFKDV